jgi:signal peptidase
MTSDKSEEKSDDGFGYKEAGKFAAETIIISLILIGIPFLISGVWPPFVSVISDSMEPTMSRGDMIFIVENERFSDESDIEGIEVAEQEGEDGDVIVYRPNGQKNKTPVIHRAVLYVEEGENWVKKADSRYLSSNSCAFTSNCPAPNSGFITLGDSNNRYDQSVGISSPVKEEWVIGKAKQKIPFVGWIRVTLSGL